MKYDCNFTEVIVIKKTFMKSWWRPRAGVKTFLHCHLFFFLFFFFVPLSVNSECLALEYPELRSLC